MATVFTDLSTQTNTLVTNLGQLWASYTQAKTAAAATTAQQGTLQNIYSEKELVLRDLQRQEDTLNQQYLDQRANPAPKTFFARMGLGTNQDWVLAFFFFSYAILSVMGLIAFSAMSTQPLRVGVFGVLLSIFIGFTMSLLIRWVG